MERTCQDQANIRLNDGINYEGIVFPTRVKQIDKLDAQNRNLAMNVFGCENDCVIVHRISRRNVPRINMMLIESGEKQHYFYVRNSAYFCLIKQRIIKHTIT